jgi:hypothetical protein
MRLRTGSAPKVGGALGLQLVAAPTWVPISVGAFIQKRQLRCLLVVMKCNLYPQPGRPLLVLCLFITISFFVAFRHLKSSSRVGSGSVSNNPDKFYLWATNSSFCYTFTYDPHAADVWLFESGGGQIIGAAPAMVRMPKDSANQKNGR